MIVNVPSYVAAPLILCAAFFLLLFLTVGVKSVVSAIKARFFNGSKNDEEKKTVKTEKPRKKRALKPVRSIEIDPDEVDRIYVRKIS